MTSKNGIVELDHILAQLKTLDKTDIDSSVRSMLRQVTGIIGEIKQHQQGGYFAAEYVKEKCVNISIEAKLIQNE